MIKKTKDWTFTECQAHAKGLLEGLGLGSLITFSLMVFGYLVYQVFQG